MNKSVADSFGDKTGIAIIIKIKLNTKVKHFLIQKKVGRMKSVTKNVLFDHL